MTPEAFGTTNEKVRENWIAEQLLSIPKGSIILDAGAGDQHHRKNCAHLIYMSQDNAGYDGKGDDKGLQTGSYLYGALDIVSDITAIPKEDNSFDAILCTEVLEHVRNPELAISELARLLRPQGKLILTAPFGSLTHFAPHHYFTGFSRYWYDYVLPKYHLKIEKIDADGDYFAYMAQELRRLPYIANMYSEKPTMYKTEYEAIDTLLSLLERFSNPGNKSSDLLTYGFMVVAEKVI